jgi:hypothetical protein
MLAPSAFIVRIGDSRVVNRDEIAVRTAVATTISRDRDRRHRERGEDACDQSETRRYREGVCRRSIGHLHPQTRRNTVSSTG